MTDKAHSGALKRTLLCAIFPFSAVAAWLAVPFARVVPVGLLVGLVLTPLLVLRGKAAPRVLVAVLANLLLVGAAAAAGYSTTTLAGSWKVLGLGLLVAIWIAAPIEALRRKEAPKQPSDTHDPTAGRGGPLSEGSFVIVVKALTVLAATPLFALLFSPFNVGFPGLLLVAAGFGVWKIWPQFLNGHWTNYVAVLNVAIYPVWTLTLWGRANAIDKMYYLGGLVVLLVLSTLMFTLGVAERRIRSGNAGETLPASARKERADKLDEDD